ncbi:hypothetical protein SI65_09057 [Aspergillus cristatus]|uniref:Uncharacterized protein n=1 Tax=Aspergillus cristatus TaxID=573508 RepID=A0A1E3B3F5_ASPCR|nr:hypothetical protein SI65_09057 [Aspergillus cristatus]
MLEQLGDRRREIDQEKADESNYMSFNNIPPTKFAAIDKYRERNRVKLRFTYFPAIETLIVKIPTAKCEAAHRNFEGLLSIPAKELGVEVGEFCSMGATTYTYRYRSRAQDRSLKEGDSTYKNRRLRRNDEGLPSLVVEAGNSEKSLDHLKAAAKWWIETSRARSASSCY